MSRAEEYANDSPAPDPRLRTCSPAVLRIGVDGRTLVDQPTGVGRYLVNLLDWLPGLDPGRVRFRLYLPRERDSRRPPRKPREGLETVRLGALPGRLDNVLSWTHLRLPMHLVRRRVELLHAPFYSLPRFCPCPAVVTIHDVTFDLHPEWFSRRARIAFRFVASSARRARHVLTVSERSRRDILSAYGLSPERVTAVPLAPDPVFQRVRDAGKIEQIRRKYGIGESFLLHVGSVTPRRNVPRLLDAFSRLLPRAPGLMLMLAGRVLPPSRPIEDEIALRGLDRFVRAAGYVDDSDLPALYSAATAVVCPSLYEGFGLPLLEAMACGTPVLAADASCFPEVAGGAALLVDPLDTDAIAEGLWSLLSDANLRETLVQRGFERVRGYSWERTARDTLAVYRRALGQDGRSGNSALVCR